MSSHHYDFLFKILIVGDSGVGKTAILQRYCNNTFDERYISTIGVDFKPMILNVGERTIKLQIWDTAGQERFMNITAAYFRNTTAVIIVYDVNNRDSLNKVYSWYGEVNEKTTQPNPVIFLVGNKKDENSNSLIDIEEAKNIASKLGNIKVMECSAKDNIGIKELFGSLVDIILEKIDNNSYLPKESQYVDGLTIGDKKESNCC
ncbi:hypothetical protein ENUP19_0305G0094 [Entamoeba nuttalli]|uniref:Rab family GTPase n=2 Tax=Entamoeba nuttalli TaxID=412467 RepID=K2HWH5_ENTNP|nr:Rab family GTPase [Entamoeba nuttalli P19]EKE40595.1 Rab family GTPase [Entamoeba nuttalli P19]|eukprot:XP_008857071.1 Rab family GTPase [Entamoeba nuttalli P19]